MNDDLSRRDFLWRGGLAVGALSLPLIGCGGDNNDAASSGGGSSALTGQEGGPVSLTMWSHEGDVAKYLNERVKELSAAADAKWQYEPIKATVHPLQQMVTKVFATLSSRRNIPDIVSIEINSFSRYMARDLAAQVLVDLTPLIGNDVKGLYPESATAPYTLDGKIYAIGCDYPLMTYYYREDLARELGITLPIATWEEMLEIGVKVAKPKGKYLSTLGVGGGGVGTAGISSQFINWLRQRGGSVFDEDGKTVVLDSPEAVDVMTFMLKALKDEVFLGVHALFGPADVAAFKTGKAIGHEGADWWRYMITRNLTDQFGKWRITEMPRFEGGGSATASAGGTGYAITKASKKQAPAWNLLRESLMSPEGERKKFEALNFLPILKSAYEDPYFLEFKDEVFDDQETFRLYAELAPEAITQPQSPHWNRALEALDRELADVYAGRKSPSQAVTDAAADIKAAISRDG